MALPPVACTGTSTMPERLCSPFLSVARRIFPCIGHVASAQSCGSSPVCSCSHLQQTLTHEQTTQSDARCHQKTGSHHTAITVLVLP